MFSRELLVGVGECVRVASLGGSEGERERVGQNNNTRERERERESGITLGCVHALGVCFCLSVCEM